MDWRNSELEIEKISRDYNLDKKLKYKKAIKCIFIRSKKRTNRVIQKNLGNLRGLKKDRFLSTVFPVKIESVEIKVKRIE